MGTDADGAAGADEEGGDDIGDNAGDGAEQEDDGEEMQPTEFMNDMDLDKDGFLTLSELMPEEDAIAPDAVEDTQKLFKTADGDNDGKLSLDELPTLIKEIDNWW